MTQHQARSSQIFQSKNEQNVRKLPPSAVYLDVVRMFETRLHERRMLSYPSNGAFPLWFLVETERNTFLWRRGLSLADACLFEFWIDPYALIEKRRRQLDLCGEENPFVSPAWADETAPEEEMHSSREESYLEAFLDLFERSMAHLHALSVASTEILKETNRAAQIERVLLPASYKHPPR